MHNHVMYVSFQIMLKIRSTDKTGLNRIDVESVET